MPGTTTFRKIENTVGMKMPRTITFRKIENTAGMKMPRTTTFRKIENTAGMEKKGREGEPFAADRVPFPLGGRKRFPPQ